MTDDLSGPLDRLPLFASDEQLAEAIVGKKAARDWLKRLPTLEAKAGFPAPDPVHGGRPVALVRLFYRNYLHLPASGRGAPDGPEDESAWARRRGSGRRA